MYAGENSLFSDDDSQIDEYNFQQARSSSKNNNNNNSGNNNNNKELDRLTILNESSRSCIDNNVSEQMLQHAMKVNHSITGAETPHATRCSVGPLGNVYQWIVLNIPADMLHDEATQFQHMKKFKPDEQLFFKAWMFIIKALCLRPEGKGSISFFKNGRRRPSFIVKAEQLVTRLYDNKNVEDCNDKLPFQELLRNSNKAGLRFHVLVLDPEYSVDSQIRKLLYKNALKNGVCLPDSGDDDGKEGENEDEEDNNNNRYGDEDGGGGGDGGDGRRAESEAEDEEEELARERANRKQIIMKTVAKRKARKLKDDLELEEDGTQSSVNLVIENMHKTIWSINNFVELVLYPLTSHPLILEQRDRVSDHHDIRRMKLPDSDQINMLNSHVWGSFQVSSCVLFDRVSVVENVNAAAAAAAAAASEAVVFDADAGSGSGSGSGSSSSSSSHHHHSNNHDQISYTTRVCDEQLNVRNYMRELDSDGNYELCFPCNELVCEYNSFNFLRYKKMKEQRLPFSVSVFDVCMDVLHFQHKKKLHTESMNHNRNNEELMLNTISEVGRLRGNIGMVDMVENVKLSRYEGLDNTFKARNVAKVADLEFMNEKEDRSMGGDFLVAYNSMSKLKESVNWVKSCMEQEFTMMYSLMQDEAMLRFRKLCQPEMDLSNSFKQALNWFNNIVNEGRWSTFYCGVLSVDYTKGRCISLAAKEFMFYEAFCLLASQHSEMRDINASSRHSHQFYRFLRACGLSSLGIHIIMLGAAGCGKSVVMDRVRDAMISLTVTDDDTTTDKYRTASYQQGELIVSDEAAVTTSGSGGRMTAEMQQKSNNEKSMMSKQFTVHRICDMVKNKKTGRKTRVGLNIRKDQQTSIIACTNFNDTKKDVAKATRFEFHMMGMITSRPGKSIPALASCRLSPEEVRSRDAQYYPWNQSTQFLCMMANKLQALGFLPCANIELGQIYYRVAVDVMEGLDPHITSDIRSCERTFAKFLEMAVRMAVDLIFHSEISPAELVSEHMHISHKPFDYDDMRALAPHLCLREDAAIKIIMESMQLKFPKLEHEFMMWVAVTLGGYRLPRDEYHSEENIQWLETLYKTSVFRSPLVSPTLRIKNGPMPQLEKLSAAKDPITGAFYPLLSSSNKHIPAADAAAAAAAADSATGSHECGVYYPTITMMCDLKELVNLIIDNKTIGMRLGWAQVMSMLSDLRRRTMEFEYPVFTESDEMEFDPAVVMNQGNNHRLRFLGFIRVRHPIIELQSGSASAPRGRIKISLGFVDKTPEYYSQKVLAHLMHMNIRESGTIITQQGKIDIEQKVKEKVTRLLKEAVHHSTCTVKRHCNHSQDRFKLRRMEKDIENIKAMTMMILPIDTQLRLKNLELQAKKLSVELLHKETQIRAQHAELMDCTNRCTRLLEDPIDLDFEGAKYSIENAAKIAVALEQNQQQQKKQQNQQQQQQQSQARDEDLNFHVKKLQDIIKQLNFFFTDLLNMRNGAVNSSTPDKSAILQELALQVMSRDNDIIWCELDNEVPEVLDKAIVKQFQNCNNNNNNNNNNSSSSSSKILRTRRYVHNGLINPRFPYLYQLSKVTAGYHKLRVKNPKFMDAASYKNLTMDYNLIKRANINFSADRKKAIMSHKTDMEHYVYDRHLRSIGIPESEFKSYYPRNTDDVILITRESYNRYHLESGLKDQYMGRDNYPKDFVESARAAEELITLNKKTQKTVIGDPDQAQVNYYIRNDSTTDSVKEQSAETSSNMLRNSSKRRRNSVSHHNDFSYTSSSCDDDASSVSSLSDYNDEAGGGGAFAAAAAAANESRQNNNNNKKNNNRLSIPSAAAALSNKRSQQQFKQKHITNSSTCCTPKKKAKTRVPLPPPPSSSSSSPSSISTSSSKPFVLHGQPKKYKSKINLIIK